MSGNVGKHNFSFPLIAQSDARQFSPPEDKSCHFSVSRQSWLSFGVQTTMLFQPSHIQGFTVTEILFQRMSFYYGDDDAYECPVCDRPFDSGSSWKANKNNMETHLEVKNNAFNKSYLFLSTRLTTCSVTRVTRSSRTGRVTGQLWGRPWQDTRRLCTTFQPLVLPATSNSTTSITKKPTKTPWNSISRWILKKTIFDGCSTVVL